MTNPNHGGTRPNAGRKKGAARHPLSSAVNDLSFNVLNSYEDLGYKSKTALLNAAIKLLVQEPVPIEVPIPPVPPSERDASIVAILEPISKHPHNWDKVWKAEVVDRVCEAIDALLS